MSRVSRLWRLSCGLGVATLVVGGVLSFVLPRGSEGLPDGFRTPIVAFEFATSEGEVRALARSHRLDAFDLGNRIDFVFLLAYGAFLFTAGMAIVAGGRPTEGSRVTRRAGLALPLSVVASAADAYENIQLLALARAVREGVDMAEPLYRLAVATWIKWGSLLLAFYALLPWFWQQGRVGKAVACVAVVGILAAALAPRYRGLAHEVMASAVLATFVGLLIVAFRATRKAHDASP